MLQKAKLDVVFIQEVKFAGIELQCWMRYCWKGPYWISEHYQRSDGVVLALSFCYHTKYRTFWVPTNFWGTRRAISFAELGFVKISLHALAGSGFSLAAMSNDVFEAYFCLLKWSPRRSWMKESVDEGTSSSFEPSFLYISETAKCVFPPCILMATKGRLISGPEHWNTLKLKAIMKQAVPKIHGNKL